MPTVRGSTLSNYYCIIAEIVRLTNNSAPSSRGLTLHIMLTTFRDSTSIGSGVTDLTDSAVSGDIARGRESGGRFAPNAVSGYIPYLELELNNN